MTFTFQAIATAIGFFGGHHVDSQGHDHGCLKAEYLKGLLELVGVDEGHDSFGHRSCGFNGHTCAVLTTLVESRGNGKAQRDSSRCDR